MTTQATESAGKVLIEETEIDKEINRAVDKIKESLPVATSALIDIRYWEKELNIENNKALSERDPDYMKKCKKGFHQAIKDATSAFEDVAIEAFSLFDEEDYLGQLEKQVIEEIEN